VFFSALPIYYSKCQVKNLRLSGEKLSALKGYPLPEGRIKVRGELNRVSPPHPDPLPQKVERENTEVLAFPNRSTSTT